MAQEKIIALVGGTGNLGTLIAYVLLDMPNTRLRLLVRPESLEKVESLRKWGAEIIVGDINNSFSAPLEHLCKGAHTVISTVQGDSNTIIQGQNNLLQAAMNAGVKRFIPSDYSLNYFKVTPGHIPQLDWRRKFAKLADDQPEEIEIVHVFTGSFFDQNLLMDFLNIIDVNNKEAYVWGDGLQQMDWTNYLDTARYVGELAVDDNPVPNIFSLSSETLNFKDIVSSYEVGSGKKLQIQTLGSIAKLDDLIEKIRNIKPLDTPSYLPLVHYRAILNGEGKLDTLMNDRYPSIQPITLKKYVEREEL